MGESHISSDFVTISWWDSPLSNCDYVLELYVWSGLSVFLMENGDTLSSFI